MKKLIILLSFLATCGTSIAQTANVLPLAPQITTANWGVDSAIITLYMPGRPNGIGSGHSWKIPLDSVFKTAIRLAGGGGSACYNPPATQILYGNSLGTCSTSNADFNYDPTGTFNIGFSGNNSIHYDNSIGYFTEGQGGTNALITDLSNGAFQLGEPSSFQTGLMINIIPNTSKLQIAGSDILNANVSTGLFTLGNHSGSGQLFKIDATADKTTIGRASGNKFLSLDGTGLYKIGDIDNDGHFTNIVIDDINQQYILNKLGGAEAILGIRASGILVDTSISASGWSTTGNAGTNPLTNFLGTTDDQPLRFRINNIWNGEINPDSAIQAYGYHAAWNNTGIAVSALGTAACANNTGSQVTGLGNAAAINNTGNWVDAIGYSAAAGNAFNKIIALGVFAIPTDSDQLALSDSINNFKIYGQKGRLPLIVAAYDTTLSSAPVTGNYPIINSYPVPNDKSHAYEVGGYLTTTSLSLGLNVSFSVSYTDPYSGAETVTYTPQGFFATAISTSGNFNYSPTEIYCQAGTSITVQLIVGTGTLSAGFGAEIKFLR